MSLPCTGHDASAPSADALRARVVPRPARLAGTGERCEDSAAWRSTRRRCDARARSISGDGVRQRARAGDAAEMVGLEGSVRGDGGGTAAARPRGGAGADDSAIPNPAIVCNDAAPIRPGAPAGARRRHTNGVAFVHEGLFGGWEDVICSGGFQRSAVRSRGRSNPDPLHTASVRIEVGVGEDVSMCR